MMLPHQRPNQNHSIFSNKIIESHEQEYKPDWPHTPHIKISRSKPSSRQLQLSCWEKDTAHPNGRDMFVRSAYTILKNGPPPPGPQYGFIIQKYNPKTCLASLWFPFQSPVSEFRVRGYPENDSPMPHPSLQPAHPPMSVSQNCGPVDYQNSWVFPLKQMVS